MDISKQMRTEMIGQWIPLLRTSLVETPQRQSVLTEVCPDCRLFLTDQSAH